MHHYLQGNRRGDQDGEEGAQVRAYDPVSIEEAKHDLGDTITYCTNDMDAVQGADALALITEWSEFKVPDWEKVGQAMKTKVVFDGRNLYRREIVSGCIPSVSSRLSNVHWLDN